MALVPEAVAFAFVAGVDPLVGLYAAFFVGFITAAIGGRPGMISGATGAMAVVMTGFVVLFGVEYLFAAVVLAGIIQILAGVLQLGRFIRILPHPVMLGFVNGLAIVIGLAQFGQFKTDHRIVYQPGDGHDAAGFEVSGEWMNWASPELWIITAIVAGTMAIIHYLPKLTRAVPAPLVAIVAGTLLVAITPLETLTVRNVLDSKRVLQAEKDLKTHQFKEIHPGLTVEEVTTRAHELAAAPVKREELGEIREGLKAGLPEFHLPKIDLKDSAAMKAVVILALTLTCTSPLRARRSATTPRSRRSTPSA